MARNVIRTLKDGVRQGDAQSALALLERSIKFGHGKLAVLRYLVAERLGAPLTHQQFLYCQKVSRLLGDEEVASILRQAQRLTPLSAQPRKEPAIIATRNSPCTWARFGL
jgi:hypothetical protein